jgi:prepilin-type processing-associated H-X9-DG protein
MEEGVIPDQYDFNGKGGWLQMYYSTGEVLHDVKLDVYRCPTFDEDVNPPCRRDYYAVNGGRTSLGKSPDGEVYHDGAFYFESDTALREITDGSSKTMAVGEAIHYSLRGLGPGYGNVKIGGPGAWFYGGACTRNPQTKGCHPLTEFTARFLRSTKLPMNSKVWPILRSADNDVPMGSAHSGGAQFVFCDGHVEFLQDDIDMDAYQALSTRAGEEVVNEL